MSNEVYRTIRKLNEQLARLLRGQTAETVESGSDLDPDFRTLCETVNQLVVSHNDTRNYVHSLTEGDLGAYPPTHNLLASPFKQLQANLRHLTWQAGQIAAGDYSQRVYFMGDFAAAFNSMVEALEDKRRVENLLHSLIDSIPDLIYFKDNSGAYLGCNKAFETFCGCPRENFIGLSDLAIFPKETTEYFNEMDRQVLSQGIARRNEEWICHHDGRIFLFETLRTPYCDSRGNVLGLIGLSRDITGRKQVEEERKKLETQLHHAQKMEAMGLLAGGIAHDFNNILTAIIGYSEILAMRMNDVDPLQHYVKQVLTSAERAAEMTNGLLTFSRKQVLHAKPLNLCQVVQGLCGFLKRLIPEDIEFRTSFSDKGLTVMTDKGQIQQVLMNLVTNAKDAMPKGGCLSIEISPITLDRSFVHEHGAGRPGSYACISVSDSGNGMDDETAKRIFDPFFTTKKAGKGTGLGLAIIHGIVKQHNGYINVNSEPGIGTTFRIYLPVFDGEKIESLERGMTEDFTHGTETVILAEDDATVLELHKMILEGAGYKVIEAVNGRDAIDKFLDHQTETDILVTDIIMPKIDGPRAYEEIRKTCPDLKVLFMSGYSRDVIIERGILEDGFSYLSKPVTSATLLRSLRHILDRR